MIAEIIIATIAAIVALVVFVIELASGQRRPEAAGGKRGGGKSGGGKSGGGGKEHAPGCLGVVDCAPGLVRCYGDCFTPVEAAAVEQVVAGNGSDPFPGLVVDIDGEQLPYRESAFAATCRRPVIAIRNRHESLRTIDFIARAARDFPDVRLVFMYRMQNFNELVAAEFFPQLEFVVGVPGISPGAPRPGNVRVISNPDEFNREAESAAGRCFVIAREMVTSGRTVIEKQNETIAAGNAAIADFIRRVRPVRFQTSLFAGYPPPPSVRWCAGVLRSYPWGGPSSAAVTIEHTPTDGAPVDFTLGYDMAALERRMFRRGLAERVYGWYPHDVPIDSVPGLCSCFDCAAEIAVWRDALSRADSSGPEPGEIAAAMNRLTDGLDRAGSDVAAAGGFASNSTATLTTPPHGLRQNRPMAKCHGEIVNWIRSDATLSAVACNAAGLTVFRGHCLTDAEHKAVVAESSKSSPSPDLDLRDDSPSLPYRRYNVADTAPRVQLHNGQRKLLMSEIDFFVGLTELTGGIAAEDITVVYAGSAPGTHIPYLGKLFPKFKWELYDPRQFAPALAHTPRVRTHVQFFEDADAEKFAGRPGIVFVSDIRTGETVSSMTTGESNKLVAQDMAMQQRWVKLMQPAAYSLKFRLPYSEKAGVEQPPVEYLAGEVRIQPWAPLSSTETRLIGGVGDWDKTAMYNPGLYEKQLFYVNTILRQWRTYRHGVPTSLVSGLDLCFDCAAEVDIWRRYDASLAPGDIAQHMNDVSRLIRRSLLENAHGIFADMSMLDKMYWVWTSQQNPNQLLSTSLPPRSGSVNAPVNRKNKHKK